jgi:hypothetical protein
MNNKGLVSTRAADVLKITDLLIAKYFVDVTVVRR